MIEHDVVIVGGRLAGCTAASALARAGRDVVVLERGRFPSDTLSTHVLFGGGVDEMKRMGAFDRITALDPSYMRRLQLEIDGEVVVNEPWDACGEGDTDYVLCVPRPLQDKVLVDVVREQGVDVREGCEFLDVTWRGGRVNGVRYKDADGEERELRAKLVIGADGRKSTVAARVGAWHPYRASKNGRGLVFRYFDDPHVGTEKNETLWQWRDGTSFCMVFPSAPRPRTIALVMGPATDVARARKDPDGVWDEFLRRHPGFAARIEGGTNWGKLRSTADVPAFFRCGSGPGWALAGDASHFKDPVIGNGQRDALWMGRSLGEAAAPVIDDPAALDRALREWEQAREDECISAYHFANNETRILPVSPVLKEVARSIGTSDRPDLSDVFQRVRDQQDVLPVSRLLGGAVRAMARDPRHAPQILRDAIPELRTDLAIRAEIRAHRFRNTRQVKGSEHPGWTWPDPPRRPTRATQSAPSPATEPATPASTPTPEKKTEAVPA